MTELTIPLRSQDEAILVLGPYDRFAKLLRQALEIDIYARTGNLRLKGAIGDVEEAKRRIEHLLGKARKGKHLDLRAIEGILSGRGEDTGSSTGTSPVGRAGGRGPAPLPRSILSFREKPMEPRTESQRGYWELLEEHPLTFALGAAGTGKTFLAVAAAGVRFILLPLISRFDVIQEYVFLLAVGWCLGLAQIAEALGLSLELHHRQEEVGVPVEQGIEPVEKS